ncbi:MAG: hypothetical protein M3R17_10215 [Bacteroidota bacterium]|nr:hypothetical protein [Bacteroidota bacterium]
MINAHLSSKPQTELSQGLLSDINLLDEKLKLLTEQGIEAFDAVPLEWADGAYAQFVSENSLNAQERLLILLALAQYVNPGLCHSLVTENNDFRLVQCNKTGLLLPTGETFLRLVAPASMEARVDAHHYLGTEHLFYRKSVIDFGEVNEGVAAFFGVLKLTPSFRELFLYNRHNSPRFSAEFPAHVLETNLQWNDLMMNPSTAERLAEIKGFLDHGEELKNSWGLGSPRLLCL